MTSVDMDQERFIIHLNVADFAVAVERLNDCRLKHRPVIIASQGAPRAPVYDMSEEAFQNGVRKGMRLSMALRRCRKAHVVAAHFHQYESAAKELIRCALPYSPLVEMTDHNGHLFVDATGTTKLFGPAPDVAWRMRKAVRAVMGVDPVWSVAPNKLIAKVATRLVKPVGEYIVGAGDEARFLSPVPLFLIPGMDAKTLQAFYALNLTCAGHAAAWSKDQLQVAFGRQSTFIYAAVRGIDTAPVLPVGQKRPIISMDHEFGTDTQDPDQVLGALYALVEQAGRDLRQRKLSAKTIGVAIDYADARRAHHGVAVKPPANLDPDLFSFAEAALLKAWTRRVRLQRIRLLCENLVPPPTQMGLFETPDKTAGHHLMSTLDAIRQRFGSSAVKMGRTLPAFV